MRYFVGDVRDKTRLALAASETDYIVHAAALKQVTTAEYNPTEYIKTNIIGAQNVIAVSIQENVKKIISLSTDKAANPINLYGATKLVSDKLFLAANNLVGKRKTRFAVVRYGNVLNSRGSVVPYFQELSNSKSDHFPITDQRMTRFWITLNETAKFVDFCAKTMIGGEIFVPKIPSVKIVDLAKAINPKMKQKIIGVRPGEKLHEIMCPQDSAHTTYEFKKYYLIKPDIVFYNLKAAFEKNCFGEKGKKVTSNFEYNSYTNKSFLNFEQIKKLI